MTGIGPGGLGKRTESSFDLNPASAAQEIETKPGIPPIGLVRFVPDLHCNVSAQVLCCTLSPRGVLALTAWRRVERA